MTSQLNVDTIVDKAGSGGSNVKMANTSTYVSDGGGATQNTVQGIAKAWVQTPSGGTPADSFNISGVTDNSAGNYTVAIANDMANDDYSVTISKIVAGSNRDVNAESVATTNFIILSTAASAVEDQTCFGTIHGDLA